MLYPRKQNFSMKRFLPIKAHECDVNMVRFCTDIDHVELEYKNGKGDS
jgi:hypothetical protein